MTPLRQVKTTSGHVLTVWDTRRMIHNSKARLGYKFTAPDCSTLFEGEDFGASPMHGTDSDATLLALLSFLTLKPGDTDREYFADYTPDQLAWAQSSECESLACDVSLAEEAGGCACDYVWSNLDGWTCDAEERGNVADFEVTDHGEDGSQYFPGIPSGKWEHKVTGVGDTGKEALEDALESMAQDDAHPSKLQEVQMRDALRDPDKSAFASLDHSECGEDHDGDDWSHYVSIRYNIREES